MGRARVAAWGLWGLTMASIAGAVVLALVHGLRPGAGMGLLVAVAPVSYASVGALIASRRPRNPMGWIFLGGSLMLGSAALLMEYSVHAYTDPLPLADYAAWLGAWLFAIPLLAGVPVMLLLFPDGHLPSRRWRWVAVPELILTFYLVAAFALGGNSQTTSPSGRPLPPSPILVDALGTEGALTWFVFLAWALGVLVCAAAPLVRWRKASGAERDQLKWFGRLVGLMLGMVLLSIVLQLARVPASWLVLFATAAVCFVGLIIGIPVTFAVAILRHGLLGIDVVIRKAVVFALLAGFITLVYVGLLFGLPTVISGSGASGGNLIAIVVTAGTALLFQPVRTRAQRFANRLVYGERASPYEVLSEFSERIGGSYSTEDVLPRMVRILASGTGATTARVWLRVGDELRPAASWPSTGLSGSPPEPGPVPFNRDEDLPSLEEGAQAFPVVHGGELLGAVTVTMPPSEPLGPEQERVARDLAAQAGLVLRNVALTEELRASLEEVRASRQRIVTAADRERRKLERDIHDGAQQHLVALSVKLGLIEQLAGKADPEKLRGIAAEVKADASEALQTLRDLARGIYPPLLAESGLATALSSQASRSALPAEVDADGIGRYPAEVEAAAYFCCLEALQNAAKYSEASRVVVRLRATNGSLEFAVEDDGRGFDVASTKRGAGLQNMADRVEALGGTIELTSMPGAGTTLAGSIPVAAG